MLYFLQKGTDYALSTEKISPTFSQIRSCLDEQLKFGNKKAILPSSTVVTTKHPTCFWKNQENTSIGKEYKRQQYTQSTLNSIKNQGGTSKTPPPVAEDFLLEALEAPPD